MCLANFSPPACGDITGVAAGAGLLGGGASGDVALTVDTSAVQARVTGSCPTQNYLRVIDADGTVVCGADANSGGTVTSITAGPGLTGGTISTSGTIALAAPTATVLGGVKSSTCADTDKVTGLSTAGALTCGLDLPGRPVFTQTN